MANLNNLTFVFFAFVCLLTSGFCEDEGSGDGSGTESMFTDATEVITELVTDEDSPSDIQAYSYSITNEFTEFVLDVDNIVTFSLTVKNLGDTAIPSSSDAQYSIEVLLSDVSDPTLSTANTLSITPLLTSATNLDAAISGGGSIVIENIHTMINIASSTCSSFEDGYVCVQVEKTSDATYDDSDSTNNYYCLQVGAVADGLAGELVCSACAVKMSLLSILLFSLVAYFTSS